MNNNEKYQIEFDRITNQYFNEPDNMTRIKILREYLTSISEDTDRYVAYLNYANKIGRDNGLNPILVVL